jgi:uncharacterized protein (TIGR00296 family)
MEYEALEKAAGGLLARVRPVVEGLVGGEAMVPRLPELGFEPGGLFVTLYDGAGELRGSGGTTRPDRPLDELLLEACRQAAVDDPRFPPLGPDELGQVRFALTLLGPGRRIRSPGELEPGVDALRVEQGIRGGTTTPEVAFGRGWDAEVFVAFACRKAGLPAVAWRDESVRLEAFASARVTEES